MSVQTALQRKTLHDAIFRCPQAAAMIDSHMTEALGYTAAALVLGTFALRSLVTLRSVAIVRNVLFIAYAACANLLPLNFVRLCEVLGARDGESQR